MIDFLISPTGIILILFTLGVATYKLVTQTNIISIFSNMSKADEAIQDADIIFRDAQQAYIEKKYDKALSLFNESANMFRSNGARLQYARTLIKVAELSLQVQTVIDTLDTIEEANNIFQDLENLNGRAEVLKILGDYHWHSDNAKQAKEHYHEAIILCQEIGDIVNLARIYKNLGNIDIKARNFSDARSHYDKAIPLLQDSGSTVELAQTLFNLGTLEYRLINYNKAKNCFQQAISCYNQLNDKKGLANSHYGIGTIDYDSSSYIEAIKSFKESLSAYGDIHDDLGIGRSRLGLGTSYEKLNMINEALKELHLALPILEQQNATADQAKGLIAMGYVEMINNHYTDALNYFLSAKPLYQIDSNERGEARALLGIGDVKILQGFESEAQSILDEALDKLQRYSDKEGLALVNISLSRLEAIKQNYSKASQYISNTIDIATSLKNKQLEGIAYYELGLITMKSDSLLQAKSHFNRALQSVRNISNSMHEAHILLQLAVLDIQENQLLNVNNMLQQAYTIYHSFNNIEGQAACNIYLASLAFKDNNLPMAREKIDIVFETFTMLHKPELIAEGAIIGSNIYKLSNDTDKATKILVQGKSLIEKIGNNRYSAKLQLEIARLQTDNPKESISQLKTLAKNFKDSDDLANYVIVLIELGKQYNALQDNVNAKAILTKAVQTYDSHKDLTPEASLYKILGDVEQQQESHDKACEYYENAIKHAQHNNDNNVVIDSYLSLGQLNFKNKPSKAYGYYKEAEKLSRKLSTNDEKFTLTLWRLGMLEFTMNNLDEAQQYWHEAKNIFHANKDNVGEANCLSGLASINIANNKLDDALKNFKTASRLFRSSGNIQGEAQSYIDIAKIYKQQDDSEHYKKMTDNAIFLYKQIGEMDRAKEIQANLL